MYNLYLENRNGRIDLMAYQDFKVIDVDGIGGTDADINETENATIDGSMINSSRLDSREIGITIRIFANCGESRKTIYKYATIKEDCKLTLVNDIRSVYIEGKVKGIETPLFTEKEIMTIKVKCPSPYFNALSAIISEFSNTIKKFHFPFAIEEGKPIPFSTYSSIIVAEVMNSGDVETGAIFTYEAKGEVVNPTLYNVITNEKIKLNVEMQLNDRIEICTIPRQKHIYFYRNNEPTNIIGLLDSSSTWLTLKSGKNTFSYTCERGAKNLIVYVEFTNKYLGL